MMAPITQPWSQINGTLPPLVPVPPAVEPMPDGGLPDVPQAKLARVMYEPQGDFSDAPVLPKITLPSKAPKVMARVPNVALTDDPLQRIEGHAQNKLEQDERKDQNPFGSANNHPGFGGKLAHVFSKIGNVAGDVFVPNVMARIPGTDLNRQVEESGLAKTIGDVQQAEAENEQKQAQAEEEQARADALENPNPAETKWKPLLGGNGQTITAPNGNIIEADEQGNLRAVALPQGATVTPKATSQPHDAFHEWLSDPQKFEEFLKAQTDAKKTPAKGFGSFAGMYAAYHMLHDAYTHNPALLPILGPMLAAAMKSNGFPLPADAASVLGSVPEGQPENDQGKPIGTAMPEAPTAGTRGRGQFAGELLPTMKEAAEEIDRLGDKLGPFAGRYSDLITSKVGAYGPEFSGLQTDMQNIATGWGRAHGNSEKVMQEFRDDLNASKDPANLKAKLAHYEHQAEIYKEGGAGRPDKYNTDRKEAQTFTDGGVTYRIPADKVAEFKKDHPNAR